MLANRIGTGVEVWKRSSDLECVFACEIHWKNFAFYGNYFKESFHASHIFRLWLGHRSFPLSNPSSCIEFAKQQNGKNWFYIYAPIHFHRSIEPKKKEREKKLRKLVVISIDGTVRFEKSLVWHWSDPLHNIIKSHFRFYWLFFASSGKSL